MFRHLPDGNFPFLVTLTSILIRWMQQVFLAFTFSTSTVLRFLSYVITIFIKKYRMFLVFSAPRSLQYWSHPVCVYVCCAALSPSFYFCLHSSSFVCSTSPPFRLRQVSSIRPRTLVCLFVCLCGCLSLSVSASYSLPRYGRSLERGNNPANTNKHNSNVYSLQARLYDSTNSPPDKTIFGRCIHWILLRQKAWHFGKQCCCAYQSFICRQQLFSFTVCTVCSYVKLW